MKAIAVGSMRPKAAGSVERISVGVMSGLVRLGIIGNRGIADHSAAAFTVTSSGGPNPFTPFKYSAILLKFTGPSA